MSLLSTLLNRGKKVFSKAYAENLQSGATSSMLGHGSNRERVRIQKNLNMSRKELFLSAWNTEKLRREMFFNYRELIGGKLSYAYFITNVPKWMKTWKRLPVLDDFEDLRHNFVDTFIRINKIFICDHLEKLRTHVNAEAITDIKRRYGDKVSFDDVTNEDVDLYYAGVPYYEQWEGETTEGEANLYKNITINNVEHNDYARNIVPQDSTDGNSLTHLNPPKNANIGQGRNVIDAIKQEAIDSTPNRSDYYVEDYRNIDAWDNNYIVYRDNEDYRYHNEIPIYQKSMQKRHYDRASEGLRQRGSVVNDRQRKYDLCEIEEGFYAYPAE